MQSLINIEKIGGCKIMYSTFLEKYIVLKPKGNGKSEMHRFPTQRAAEDFVGEVPVPWWAKD